MKTFNINRILMATDFSATNKAVLQQAAQLAINTRAEIILFTVLEGSNVKPDERYFEMSTYNHSMFDDLMAGTAKKKLEKHKTTLIEKGVQKVSYMIERGKPYEKILEAAIAIKADIIIMGTPRVAETSEIAVASNTYSVVSKAACPVLSVQDNFSVVGVKNILLPFQDKPHSREDIEYAIEIAKIYGSTIHILGISYDTSEEGIKKIQLEAAQIEKILQKRKIRNTVSVVNGEYTAKLINSYITVYKADMLVVMADIDKVSLSEYIVGPVLQQLINHSQIPVFSIVPAFNFNTLQTGEESVNAVDWKFWN